MSFAESTGHSLLSPEYLLSCIIIFLMGVTVASSSTFHFRMSNLMPKSSKEIQPLKGISISEVQDRSEPELLNKSVHVPNNLMSSSDAEPSDMTS